MNLALLEGRMKRFGLVLIALGLIIAFSVPAAAVDVKFSGSFYAAGMYQDKTTVMKDSGCDGVSTAFYYQRLRVQTEFIVHPGLKLITRFDAMERAWGAPRSASMVYNSTTKTWVAAPEAPDSAGTFAENENIAFDEAYVHYVSPIGEFKVGYKEKALWGPDFANNGKPAGLLFWGKYFAPAYLYVWGQIVKINDNSYTAKNSTSPFTADRDNDEYQIGVHYYGIKNVEIAFMYDYARYASGKSGYTGWVLGPTGWVWSDYGYLNVAHIFEPYIRGKIGPVKFEAEVDYAVGDWIKYEGQHPYYYDMKLTNLQAYAKAIADFGFVYVGGIAAYVSGDDPGTTDKAEGGYLNGGREFKPCLVMFNSERNDWAGMITGYNAGSYVLNPKYTYGYVDAPMQNAWFFQLIAGVKPIDNLDIMATFSYANADKKPTAAWKYNDYGYEVDLTATYKITNNLSYMLGGGYLFTGKYYRGESDLHQVRDNYLFINKLTLTF